VAVSKFIVERMTQSLRAYMSEQGVIFENYRVEPSELEERQDIPKARIALYEDSETTLERTNVVKPSMTLQNYLIDVSVVRAYRGDKANRGEFVILDLCDAIKEWVKQVNVSILTDMMVYSIDYSNASRNLRNNKYVTKTLTFVGKRDLYFNQILVPVPGLNRAIADGGTFVDSQGAELVWEQIEPFNPSLTNFCRAGKDSVLYSYTLVSP